MRGETLALLKQFYVNTFGNKKNIESAEEDILPGETLFYISPTNLTTEGGGLKKTTLPGILFISNKRVYFKNRAMSQVVTHEFPLWKISSVGSVGSAVLPGQISFYCENKKISFISSYKEDICKRVSETLIYVIAEFGLDAAPRITVACQGCGSTGFMLDIEGAEFHCSYCG